MGIGIGAGAAGVALVIVLSVCHYRRKNAPNPKKVDGFVKGMIYLDDVANLDAGKKTKTSIPPTRVEIAPLQKPEGGGALNLALARDSHRANYDGPRSAERGDDSDGSGDASAASFKSFLAPSAEATPRTEQSNRSLFTSQV